MIKKYLLFFCFLTIHVLGNISNVCAADLTITCNSSSCTSSGGGLFNQTDIAPGYSIAKSFIINNSSNIDSCNLNLLTTRDGAKQDPDLADKILSIIQSNGNVFFNGKFSDLMSQNISLGFIGTNSSREYSWSANFDTDAGNNYQGLNVSFGFNLNFTCATAPAATLTPTPVVGPNLIIIQNPNVLGAATGNNVQTDNIIILFDGNSLDKGEVLGDDCINLNTQWWVILVIQILLTVIILVIKEIKISLKALWLLLFVFAVASQLSHNYLGCSCNPEYWCEKYIYLTIIILLLGISGYYLLIRIKSLKQTV